MKTQIIYVGLFRFPTGDAAAVNVYSIGKALRDSGYDVIFAPGNSANRPQDRIDDASYTYGGFQYYPQSEFRTVPLAPLRRLIRYLAVGTNTLRWLRSRDNSKVRAIIFYGESGPYYTRLQAFCKKMQIALIPHSVEWFDPGHCVGGRYGPIRWDVSLMMRYFSPRSDRIICISSFLEGYFRNYGCRVLRLPPLIDLDLARAVPSEERDPSGPLRILFLGSPHRERWDIILAGLIEAKKNGTNVCLEMLGTDHEKWLNLIGRNRNLAESLGGAIRFHGYVMAPEAVAAKVAQCDAGIIVREDARWSRACFPTKVPEFLAQGVPIICNLTSDLGDYLKDGVNAFIMERASIGEVAKCLARFASLTGGERARVRAASRQSAVAFHYKTHISEIASFFSETSQMRPES